MAKLLSLNRPRRSTELTLLYRTNNFPSTGKSLRGALFGYDLPYFEHAFSGNFHADPFFPVSCLSLSLDFCIFGWHMI